MPKLSAIVIARNEEQFIGEQLQALCQELRPEDELICVDDASTDRTGAIIADLQWVDVISVRFTRQTGVNQACNTVAAAAHGDWLSICSGNDVVQKGWISAWLRALERYPDARLVCGDVGRQSDPPRQSEPELRTVRREGPNVPGPGVFIRRDMWESYGGYRLPLKAAADWYLNHTIALRHGYVYLVQPMAWERPHEGRYGSELRSPEIAAGVAAELLRLWQLHDNSDIIRLWDASGLMDVASAFLGQDLRARMKHG
jgi:glycosyltransferase involved in cell wall biosynthesis